MRLVQGQMGHLLADHPARADRGAGRRWRRSQTRVRGDDEHEEDRRRGDQEGAGGVMGIPESAECVGKKQPVEIRVRPYQCARKGRASGCRTVTGTWTHDQSFHLPDARGKPEISGVWTPFPIDLRKM